MSSKNKSILLIDADSKIPNIALMKLSHYFKQKGYRVDFVQLNLSYYPHRKKRIFYSPNGYNKVFCSIIFPGNRSFIRGNKIIYGGTGFDLSINLPNVIEYGECDYTLYNEKEFSYGFISRGCIRKCPFCFIPKKEGYLHKVNKLSDIIRHNKVKFLDANFLALPSHKKILSKLCSLDVMVEFNQGLDIRLLDTENSYLLSKLNYIGPYSFSFGDYSYLSIIEKKLPLLSWRKVNQIRFFVYVSPKMPLCDTIARIKYLRHNGCCVYLMRDIACWDSDFKDFYTDLAAYCNQVNMFSKTSFSEFMEIYHGENRSANFDRMKNNIKLWGIAEHQLKRKFVK